MAQICVHINRPPFFCGVLKIGLMAEKCDTVSANGLNLDRSDILDNVSCSARDRRVYKQRTAVTTVGEVDYLTDFI